MLVSISPEAKSFSKYESYTHLMAIKEGKKELTPELLDSLLLYFVKAPSKTKPKNPLEWLGANIRCKPQDNDKFIYRNIAVQQGITYTCSYALVMKTYNSGLEDGYYEPKTLLPIEKPEGEYVPEVSKLFKEGLSVFHTTEADFDLNNIKIDKQKAYIQVGKQWFDHSELLRGLGGQTKFNFKVLESGNLHGSHPFGSFILAPINPKFFES